MTLMEAARARHSVRSFYDKSIEADVATELAALVAECNDRSGLHMQLMLDDPAPFSGLLSRIGWLAGVHSYLALVGSKDGELDERCGYWGERLVLEAQARGVNSCWVGGSYRPARCAAQVGPSEKLALVVALGYGKTQGKPRKSKKYEDVTSAGETAPDWFKRGVACALLAPTAMNQQKFRFEFVGDRQVRATTANGPFAKVDLGIAKFHFELGAGEDGWSWVK